MLDDRKQRERKWRLYKGTWSLWMRLLPIDKDASVWLIAQHHTCPSAACTNKLVVAFAWMDTPQGAKYWSELRAKLGEKD